MGYVLDQSYNVAEDSSFRIGTIDATGEVKEAQSFTPTITGPINRITVKLAKNGTPSGNIVMTLEADSAGSPSGTPLATATSLSCASITSSPVYYDIDFPTPFTATAGVVYWYVLAGTFTQSDTDNVKTYGNSAAGYAGGVPKTWNGASWSSALSADFVFLEYNSGSSGGLLSIL